MNNNFTNRIKNIFNIDEDIIGTYVVTKPDSNKRWNTGDLIHLFYVDSTHHKYMYNLNHYKTIYYISNKELSELIKIGLINKVSPDPYFR